MASHDYCCALVIKIIDAIRVPGGVRGHAHQGELSYVIGIVEGNIIYSGAQGLSVGGIESFLDRLLSHGSQQCDQGRGRGIGGVEASMFIGFALSEGYIGCVDIAEVLQRFTWGHR